MILQLTLAFAAGGALAGFHLTGLWLFTRGLAAAPRPMLSLAVGTLVRLGVTLAGFFTIATFGPYALSAALAGFVMVRIATTRCVVATMDG